MIRYKTGQNRKALTRVEVRRNPFERHTTTGAQFAMFDYWNFKLIGQGNQFKLVISAINIFHWTLNVSPNIHKKKNDKLLFKIGFDKWLSDCCKIMVTKIPLSWNIPCYFVWCKIMKKKLFRSLYSCETVNGSPDCKHIFLRLFRIATYARSLCGRGANRSNNGSSDKGEDGAGDVMLCSRKYIVQTIAW